MTYFVRQMDPRFSMITMSVDGAHLEGEIKAFYYQPPVVQPSMIDLKNVVVSREFTGHKILVVGASRGLGEVVSKLVAEGGGEVILTYHKGQQEAEAIVSEISARGGNATCVAIDVTNPNLTLDAFGTVMSDISAVFYFASPKISGTRSGNFDVSYFNRMANVFVGGACRIVSLVAGVCRPNALIFYPSTVFLDDVACGWSGIAQPNQQGKQRGRRWVQHMLICVLCIDGSHVFLLIKMLASRKFKLSRLCLL